MKRFALLATTCACALWIGTLAHSQTGGGTAGGGAGSASGGTGSGGVQAGTGSGGVGTQTGATGVGVPGQAAGAAGQPNPGVTGQPGQVGSPSTFGQTLAPGQPGQARPSGFNNFPSQTPWFGDPAVRQQLQMNDAQFNALNARYRNAWNRFNRNVRGINDGGLDNPAGIRPFVGQGQQNVRTNARQNRRNAQLDQRNAANQRQATANAQQNLLTQQQQAQRIQQLRQRFDDDFSQFVDTTLTDPAARQRFNELNLQFQGAGAFTNPAVAQQLNLNPQQQAQFTRMAQDWNEALARLQLTFDQDPRTATQQYNQLRMQANEQLTALLSPQQLANWRRMSGVQFEFPASAFLRPSTQSLDPTGDTVREQVNEQLENQQNDSIFDGDRVPGQGGSEIGTEASPGTSSNLDIGNPQNDSTIPQPSE